MHEAEEEFFEGEQGAAPVHKDFTRNKAQDIIRKAYRAGQILESERGDLLKTLRDLSPENSEQPKLLKRMLRGEVLGALQRGRPSGGHQILPC